ncbi:MAG: hypothetical protein UT30_C0018G0009 [Candidatus Uhrbacteria bacterium GW2011_GWF2_39_13]|uniref:Uncharacterized protein n=1 Tax=Candidatus Uhrbacteria bacterium GW2011_GWF2_39_13 TaxID=1618995 RepID=A0A0G0Q098_9BACT|nr:MAG: hypothetical protein UT30_C0018G0009 [Candidatus Uhrbacteria bacterium GW2011_GWF2_39_13]HAU65937.1 hypothetical protein [Candidatus Uhrbacteria bacterium]
MSRKALNIEELLETMGSVECSEDSTHRYELRRKLLCSRLFEFVFQNNKTTRLVRVFTYTAPLIAGGMMVGVFVLFAVPSVEEEAKEHSFLQTQVVEFQTQVTADISQANEFISDPLEPKVKLVDFEIEESKEKNTFIPLNQYQSVRTQ